MVAVISADAGRDAASPAAGRLLSSGALRASLWPAKFRPPCRYSAKGAGPLQRSRRLVLALVIRETGGAVRHRGLFTPAALNRLTEVGFWPDFAESILHSAASPAGAAANINVVARLQAIG